MTPAVQVPLQDSQGDTATTATASVWSLVCKFERPPSAQGDPSIAHVRYLVPNAQSYMIPSQLS
jgi:hypothetical protein